jgi:HK97 family phage major capsid protein
MKSISELRSAYQAAQRRVKTTSEVYDRHVARGTDQEVEAAKTKLAEAIQEAEDAETELNEARTIGRARTGERVSVREPDMYERSGDGFLQDLYRSQLKGDPAATERIARHHTYAVEQRAVTTAGLGGIIPPQFLVDLYAKAPRNGRVFIDQCNGDDPLPDTGMSLIVPRLTQGTAAAVQATENSALTTQDPTELDLTVPVCTVGGYVPVSRQTLDRAAYSEGILFEDLLARYNAAADVEGLSGAGAAGHALGLLQTSGLCTSVAGSATIASIWPKIADVIQQINTAVGGLGYTADKIVMHPRRWGFFEAALDSANRPVFGINGLPNYAPNADGDAAGYGFVGRMHGLPVFTDANVPTNFHTDEDAIIVMASRLVHIWENPDGPRTVAFEQQAGTSLQVQLVAYGYLGFTAGRYPAASGYVYGAGLTAPSFGS